jgi:hypothetical protein
MTSVMPGKFRPPKRAAGEDLPIEEQSRTLMKGFLRRVGNLPSKPFVVCFGIGAIVASAYVKAPVEAMYAIGCLVSVYLICESVKLVIKSATLGSFDRGVDNTRTHSVHRSN